MNLLLARTILALCDVESQDLTLIGRSLEDFDARAWGTWDHCPTVWCWEVPSAAKARLTTSE